PEAVDERARPPHRRTEIPRPPDFMREAGAPPQPVHAAVERRAGRRRSGAEVDARPPRERQGTPVVDADVDGVEPGAAGFRIGTVRALLDAVSGPESGVRRQLIAIASAN